MSLGGEVGKELQGSEPMLFWVLPGNFRKPELRLPLCLHLRPIPSSFPSRVPDNTILFSKEEPYGFEDLRWRLAVFNDRAATE
jgi:hypothetical protein